MQGFPVLILAETTQILLTAPGQDQTSPGEQATVPQAALEPPPFGKIELLHERSGNNLLLQVSPSIGRMFHVEPHWASLSLDVTDPGSKASDGR